MFFTLSGSSFPQIHAAIVPVNAFASYHFITEKLLRMMVGTTGIEPVTTAMSRQYSTAELRAPIDLNLMSNQQGRARYQKDGVRVKCQSELELGVRVK